MLDKIHKLMALALNNPSEEEARSAALKAVRMIAEHKVVLMPVPKAKPAPASVFYDEGISEAILRDMMDRIRQREEAAFKSSYYGTWVDNT